MYVYKLTMSFHRDFLLRVSCRRMIDSNPKCQVISNFKNDRSEPVVEVVFNDKDTLTLETSSLRLMDMITIFNKKCREKEASGWTTFHVDKVYDFSFLYVTIKEICDRKEWLYNHIKFAMDGHVFAESWTLLQTEEKSLWTKAVWKHGEIDSCLSWTRIRASFCSRSQYLLFINTYMTAWICS